MKRVLLTSIFRPFSKPGRFNRPGDEKFLDYFSNRLTRESGPFVLHDSHPTVAPHMIAQNIAADVTVLDTPTLEEYKAELTRGYDVVGISFLTLHFAKLVHMIACARKLAPQTKVVIGGFGTALYGLERLEVDGICQGEGVRFMRQFLGQDPDSPITHPLLSFEVRLRLAVQHPGLGARRMGVIVNGFGCPHACEFCSTSAYFGKRHLPFVTTGRALYDLMTRYDREQGVRDFIIYEEDFFLYRRHIEDFLHRFAAEPAPYSYACYSTVKALTQFPIEELARTGLSHVWIGVESVDSPFSKSQGRPIQELFTELQHYGITTTGSIIAGLDYHRKDNLQREFAHLASLYPSTVQISHLIAGPGTPLRARLEREGRLLKDVDLLDSHLYSDTIAHPEFGRGELREWIFRGYDYIYQTIGPGLFRIMDTWFQGYRNLSQSPDPLLRMRARLLGSRARALAPLFLDTLDYLPNDHTRERVRETLLAIEAVIGPWTPLERRRARRCRAIINRETSRIEAEGSHIYEPPTRVTYYRAPAHSGHAPEQGLLSEPPRSAGVELTVNQAAGAGWRE